MSESDLRRYLGLDDPIATSLTALESSGVLRDELLHAEGVHLLHQDPWETLVSFILSQNSNVPRIRKNVEDIARQAGEQIGSEGSVLHALPEPSALADFGEERLRK
jgi:N-glycosylase/DNA lyase